MSNLKPNTKRNDILALTVELIVMNKFQEEIRLPIGTPVKYIRVFPLSKIILVKYFDMTSYVIFDVALNEVSGYVHD